jgi:CRISPR-associated protein Cmr6
MRMPANTAKALGLEAQHCDSRSLFFDKLADPSAKDSATQTSRTDWFKRVIGLEAEPVKLDSWIRWLDESGLRRSDMLQAKLESRLMVNMAGGVMGNAGLCLDRFGVPYVPGGAVKGCARRMAIELLKETRKSNESTDELARLLADVALVFGWSQEDWMPNKDSDFVYSVGSEKWFEVRRATGRFLLKAEPEGPEDFGYFGGAVSFLPAYPLDLPAKDLELDVITSHHTDYYKDEGNQRVATDTEEPNPVKFIAVAAGVSFAFFTLPLRGQLSSRSQSGALLYVLARDWLRQGLETFGLGAKIAAGYGWFKEVRPAQASSSTGFTGKLEVVTQQSAKPVEHPVISKWRGHAIPGNFRALLPDLAAIDNTGELRRIFDAIVPESERSRLRKANRYWQSFVSRPEGQQVLRRLGISLK